MSRKISLILLGVLLLPSIALAQLHDIGSGSISIEKVISGLERAAWIVFGGIAVICFVIAGILFMTAQGDAKKLQEARSAVFWGIFGVIIGIVAYSIIVIVSSLLQ